MYLNFNDLTILYNGNLQKGKQTVALAQSLSKKINKQDFSAVNVSRNLFCVMLSKLNVDPTDIVNHSDPYFKKELEGKAYRASEWYNIIKHHPELLINPVVLYHGKGLVCHTPTDVLKLKS